MEIRLKIVKKKETNFNHVFNIKPKNKYALISSCIYISEKDVTYEAYSDSKYRFAVKKIG